MPAKIIVDKIISEDKIESLIVSINETGDNVDTVFSEWGDFNGQFSKEVKKSPRLIVKLAPEGEGHCFDLDACAKTNNKEDIFRTQLNLETAVPIHVPEKRNSLISSTECVKRKIWVNPKKSNKDVTTVESPDPLDLSLQKVKQINARIMENIQLLNWSFNYAKSQEEEGLDQKPGYETIYPCHICGKCFVYHTGLKRHCSMRHSLLAEMMPRWQVVWTCAECFQVWPSRDSAAAHARACGGGGGGGEGVREIKTSSLLQCEFCEKVYTSIPQLLRHCARHSPERNYECTACGLAFAGHRAAEQHWAACARLGDAHRFSLPKLLLCHACDRKFRKYEQLYNHRFKVGHYMGKRHATSTKAASPVFQCETCAEWFHSVVQLQLHRTQTHPQYENI